MKDFNPITFKDPKKELIQREAYDVWLDSNKHGTLQIATGVGKTMIGIMAIQQHIPCEVIIVAPTISLQAQWIEALKESLGEYKSIHTNIGKVGNGFKEFDKPVKVCVVNSLRDQTNLKADLLILDEIHRMGSKENIKFIEQGDFKAILGLTATAVRQDGAHNELFKYAPLIYNYNQTDAINGGLLSDFELINVPVALTLEEKTKHDIAQDFIKENFDQFNYDFQAVKIAMFQSGMKRFLACDLMRAFGTRKSVLYNAYNKIVAAVDLIQQEGVPKTLVFCEYIKTAKQIYKLLKKAGVSSGIYHSNLTNQEKKEYLQNFKDGEFQILVSVKALDEGTNVPDCSMAIIVAGTSVERQMIQRLGRVLRTHEGKDKATIFQLYVPDTQDEKWLNNRTKNLR